jgi:putative hydrolase of the HAD superfamily
VHPDVRWILFDAVGTLIHPDPLVAVAYQSVAREFGVELDVDVIRERFTAAFSREFSAADGLARESTSEQDEYNRWRCIVAAVLHDVPDGAGEPFERLWRHFSLPASWRLFDDVLPALKNLAGRGYRLGIASNFDRRLLAIAQAHLLLAYCEHAFISSEISFSKPDPRYFAAVLQELGVPASEILLVGDDLKNDYEGALAAGCQAVLLTRGGGPPQARTISSLAEL